MNKENVWKVIKCGGKIVFLTVTVTGKILKELMTSKYQENLFMRTMNGNDLVDNAYRMLKSA